MESGTLLMKQSAEEILIKWLNKTVDITGTHNSKQCNKKKLFHANRPFSFGNVK